MKLTRISIAFCGAASTLALSLAASPPASKKLIPADLKNVAPHHSELRRDQAVFASDLKHLRRDLRRRSDDARMTSDRRAAQADWTSIIADRYPNPTSDS
jgi:hypothetical protein